MSGLSNIEEIPLTEDSSGDSSGECTENGTQSRQPLRDTVQKSMLPRNFENLKGFFECSNKLGVKKDRSESLTSQSRSKGPSEALKAFYEISYTKFKSALSSEEESCCSKCSHEDSQDSGLFKEGYVFERKFHPINKDAVNNKVKKWKKKASEQLDEVNKLYHRGNSRNQESFSMPLGLEVNRKKVGESTDDASSRSRSRISGQYNTEDEMDLRRNDEFIREVRRVLRSKKNPQTLEKRSLPEEYSRLIFKKSAFARNRQLKALTEKEGHESENADTGAQGGNTSEPVTDIFNQLSKMVLKNKIVKNSKAAKQRNRMLRRVEEKRNLADRENSDEEAPRETVTEFEPPGPSDLQIARPSEFTELGGKKDTTRSKKVESYLSSISDVQSISPAIPKIGELTAEREEALFDSLSGEFLKEMATGGDIRSKITRTDKKLLTIIVRRYIDRGQLAEIDRLMNSNINETTLEVPPYENVTDREDFFLKKIMKKYIKRGMRDALEDLIAWIYYKLDARKTKESETQDVYSEKDVSDMVNAFKSSGKNPSMNKVVEQLLKEHTKANPGLNSRQIEAVREMINNQLIERFARMYLERTKTDVDGNSEPLALSVSVKNDFSMSDRLEPIDVNGRDVHIKWGWKDGTGEHDDVNTEQETDSSSLDRTSPDRTSDQGVRSDAPGPTTKKLLEKDAKFVKERLEDIVWNLQQLQHRQKAGKANRTCSLVKKRSVTMIRDKNQGDNAKEKERKPDFEERRKQMREEHTKWLLEQKELLRKAKRREASNIEKYTQALPKSLENMIAKRNRSLKQFDRRNTTDKKVPSIKPRKK